MVYGLNEFALFNFFLRCHVVMIGNLLLLQLYIASNQPLHFTQHVAFNPPNWTFCPNFCSYHVNQVQLCSEAICNGVNVLQRVHVN